MSLTIVPCEVLTFISYNENSLTLRGLHDLWNAVPCMLVMQSIPHILTVLSLSLILTLFLDASQSLLQLDFAAGDR